MDPNQDPPWSAPPPPPPPPYGEPPAGFGRGYEPPPREYAPKWEHWRETGFLQAWFGTIGEVLFRPTETFGNLNHEGGIGKPLGFYILTGWVTQIIGFLLMLPFDLLMRAAVSANEPSGRSGEMFFQQGIGLGFQAVFVFVLSPVILLVGIFISCAILHLLLMLFGGARRSFETSLQVACYVDGACSVIAMVPFCGPFILIVVRIVVMSIGLARAHETDTWRAVLAILLPMILLFVCCCFAFMAIFGLAAGSPEIQQMFEEMRQMQP
jgi:hypothetical protein